MLNLITAGPRIIVVGAEPALPVNLHQQVVALRDHIRNNSVSSIDSDDGDIDIEFLFMVLDILNADGHEPGPLLCELFAQYDMCAEHGCDYDGCRDDGYTHKTEPWHTQDLANTEHMRTGESFYPWGGAK
jgi:hypothetical protein